MTPKFSHDSPYSISLNLAPVVWASNKVPFERLSHTLAERRAHAKDTPFRHAEIAIALSDHRNDSRDLGNLIEHDRSRKRTAPTTQHPPERRIASWAHTLLEEYHWQSQIRRWRDPEVVQSIRDRRRFHSGKIKTSIFMYNVHTRSLKYMCDMF